MLKIAIIGCGYVGTAFALLCSENSEITTTATTRSEKRVEALSAVSDKVKICNTSNLEEVREVLEDQDILVLTVGAGRGLSYKETYLKSAQAISDLAPDLPRLKQIIYTSSTSVYGGHNGATVTEDSPLLATTENCKVLIETEEVLRSIADKNVCIFRLAGIYGPGREISTRARRMAGQTLSGSGDNPMNMIHRDDIAQAILTAVEKQWVGTYNLSNDIHSTRREVYNQICDEAGIPRLVWDTSSPSDHSSDKVISSQKIKTLGFEIQHQEIL